MNFDLLINTALPAGIVLIALVVVGIVSGWWIACLFGAFNSILLSYSNYILLIT